MKRYLSYTKALLITFFYSSTILYAQTNTWALISNSDSVGSVYGKKDIAAKGNIPRARFDCVSWSDDSCNLWLFGGANNSIENAEVFSELWKFNIKNGEWTWVGGIDSVNQGQYGVQGAPSTTNIPRSREGAASWTDNNGNFWLFGGSGFYEVDSGGVYSGGSNYLNDLWKYESKSNEWTWVGGSNLINGAAEYGSKSIAKAGNIPGGRTGSVNWKDSNGNLWLYGGFGYDVNHSYGFLSDLWMYDINNGLWTWKNGSDKGDQPLTYLTVGVPNAANTPGNRVGSVAWVDNNSNLWMYGGGHTSYTRGNNAINDLWVYNITTNQWTILNAPDSIYANGNYGTMGIAAPSNNPGARVYSAGWVDDEYNFWLFGGYGTSSYYSGFLNDLWKYNISINEWTWVNGPDTLNNFGSSSTPSARELATSFVDSDGNFWLYGGTSSYLGGVLGDLWKYTNCSSDCKCSVDSNSNFSIPPSPLLLYPNPNDGQFIIELPLACQVTIYTTLGVTLVNEFMQKGKQPINLSTTSSAMYYLKALNSNNKQQVIKFVID